MKEQLQLMINGKKINFEKGQTILEVCQEAGVPIPTLCHDERLKPYGACRLCLVELEGVKRPLASCTTPAEKGMVITSQSQQLTRLRKMAIELLLSNHPDDCMCCEAAGS